MLTKIDKFLLAAAGVAANFAYQYGITHPSAWITAALAVATALGVWVTPNKQ